MATGVYAYDLDKIRERLPNEKLARTASMRAINRAIQAGKTQATREISKEYAVRQRQVNERVKVSKASLKNLEAEVSWRGYALNLADFKVTPNKPQPAKRPVLRATVKKATGWRPMPGVFLINTRSGVKAFRRTSQAKADGSRYPITGVWGPSIPQLLGAPNVREAVEERAQEVLHVRLDHEINRLLSKG